MADAAGRRRHGAKGLDETRLIKSAELGGTVPMWRWIGDGATTFSY